MKQIISYIQDYKLTSKVISNHLILTVVYYLDEVCSTYFTLNYQPTFRSWKKKDICRIF